MEQQIPLTNLYQIYDTKAEAVAGPIFIERRDGPAVRAFYTLLEDSTKEKRQPGLYAEDYELRLIGHQNPETSQITGCIPLTVTTGTIWRELTAPRAQQLQLAEG